MKVTWSFCGIKLRNPWGQESLTRCGMVLMWLNVSKRKAHMSWWIMKGRPWRSLEMGSILKNTMHDFKPWLTFYILLYILHCIVRYFYGGQVC